jgi:AraC family transcriptional regulator
MISKGMFHDPDFRAVHYAACSAKPAHLHADYVLTYQIRGTARSQVGLDCVFEFRRGDINLLNPGEVHSDFASPEEREWLMIGIRPKFLQDLSGALGRGGPRPPSFPSPKLKADPAIRRICESLVFEVDGQQLGRGIVIRSLATEFTIHVLRRVTRSGVLSRTLYADDESTGWQVSKAVEYLRANFQEKFDLEQVAEAAGLSKYYLERVFKRTTGLCLSTYAMLLRIDRAKELLSCPNKSIADIALELSFSDQSHFTNAFSRFAGMSPRTYREMTFVNLKCHGRIDAVPMQQRSANCART